MPDSISIRVATSPDDTPVSKLLKASYPVLMTESYEPAVLAAALPLMTQANPKLLSSGTFYLCESKDQHIVGCGGWTRERPGSGEVIPERGHIRHFATHPDWVGRGIGRAIYDRCEEEARLAGIRQFECFASLNAEGFYASLGFETVGRIEVQMAPDLTFPSILMERAI